MSASLRTSYLGLELQTPLVPSASPLGADLEMLRRLEDAGAGAVVLPSLFEEQIEHDEFAFHFALETGAEAHAEAMSYFPQPDLPSTSEAYLSHVAAAKEALSIPVIASLNGSTPGGWVRYAREIERAGADALELNVYAVEADPSTTAAQVEERILGVVRSVRAEVQIPVAVKLGPYFSAFAHMAGRLALAGANGLVLFNRFLQPNIELRDLSVEPTISLSTPDELRLPLRWIAILHGKFPVSLAATSGIHTGEDALKALLAGADVAMLASALIRHGPGHLAQMLAELSEWLDENEYTSVNQLRGSLSQASCPDPAAFERASYMRTLVSFSRIR